jgi:hypothetical protein
MVVKCKMAIANRLQQLQTDQNISHFYADLLLHKATCVVQQRQQGSHDGCMLAMKLSTIAAYNVRQQVKALQYTSIIVLKPR